MPTPRPDARPGTRVPQRPCNPRRRSPCSWAIAGIALPLLASLLIVPGQATAQSAADILSQAMERYEANLAGVEDLTVRQEVMGFETTAYLVKETVNGHSVLRPADMDLAGADLDPVDDVGDLWTNPHELYLELADRWSLDGQGSVGGTESWRLVLTDMEDLDWGIGPDDAMAPDRIELDLAVDELHPLAMSMSGTGAQGQPFTFRIHFSDYREVDGYRHPFLTRVETEGAVFGVSDAEMEQAMEGLRELEQQLEAMPEAQREMMESMMGDQIRMLEEMVAGGGLDIELRVTELQVNSGPPGSE